MPTGALTMTGAHLCGAIPDTRTDTTMTTTIEPPRIEPTDTGPGDRPSNSDRAKALGLGSSTALVVGSIIGTGVFTMPAVMAGAGTSSIITLAVVALGACCSACSSVS